jgi:DNA-binding transcriptional MerR regulator
MANATFQLESSGLLTTAEMAAALSPPVTPQMLLRYAKEGLCVPESARGGAGGKSRMWDPVKVRAALRENKKSASKHGGKRKNARGRRPKVDVKEQGLRTAFSVLDTLRQIAERREPPADAVQVNALLYYRPHELESIVKVAEAVGLTIAHLTAIEAWLKVQEKAIDIEKERGSLVKAEDVKRLQTQRLEAVRQRMLEIPAKVAAEAGGELGLDEQNRAVLRRAVELVVNAQVGLLAEGGQ